MKKNSHPYLLSFREIIAISLPRNWPITTIPFVIGFILMGAPSYINFIIGIIYFSLFYNLLFNGVEGALNYKYKQNRHRKEHRDTAKSHTSTNQKNRLLLTLIAMTNAPILAYLIISGTVVSNIIIASIVLMVLAYNIKPLRLRNITFIDSISSSLLLIILPMLFGLFYAGASSAPWLIIIISFLWGLASYILSTIPSIKSDRVRKIHTTASALGVRRANTLCLVLYLVSCTITAIVYFPWGILASLMLSVFPLNILFFRKYQSDARYIEYQRAWNNFTWLTAIYGILMVLFLFFLFDPLSFGQARVGYFAGTLLLLSLAQLTLITYNYRKFSRPKTKRIGDLPHIDIITHSTGHKDNISSTLLALIGQNYPHFDIYYANLDHNPQAQKIAESYQDSKLHIIDIDQAPRNWSPSAWASHCLLQKTHAEIIVSVDSDTLLMPNALSVIASLFEENSQDIISLLPADQNKSLWQQLISTQEQYLWFGMYPSAFTAGRQHLASMPYSTLFAFKGKSIQKVGGFKLSQNSPLGNLGMASQAKHAGLRSAFYTSADLAVHQNYSNLNQLRLHNKQKLYPSLFSNMPLSLGLATGGIITLVSPILLLCYLLLAGQYQGTVLLAFGCAILLVNRTIITLRSRQNIISSILYPLGTALFFAELLKSMIYHEVSKPRWRTRHEL